MTNEGQAKCVITENVKPSSNVSHYIYNNSRNSNNSYVHEKYIYIYELYTLNAFHIDTFESSLVKIIRTAIRTERHIQY